MKTNTIQQLEDILDGHDCHLTGEDSCECVDIIPLLIKLKRKVLLANGLNDLNRPREVIIRHLGRKI